MSFFETLKAMGLFPNAGQPAQEGQYTATNPYGLDPAMLSQARWASLGNISSQLLALGQQMTPSQRANLMSNMDFSGGLQQNMMNAAQMKLAQRKMQQDDLAIQQATDARAALAEKIKALPKGRMRDAAMFYLTAGDVDKAAEVIYKAERRLNPVTGEFELYNAFDQSPVNAPAAAAGGGPLPTGPGGIPATSSPPAASAGGVPPMPAASASGGQIDRLTANWRRITGDPNLTPDEARQISMEAVSKNDPAAGITLYREIRKQQQADANTKATQEQTNLNNNRTAAEAITKDFEASTKSYDTVIQNGQRAAQVAANPDMSAADKLATLYQFMKTLDPEGAVRDGDVAMAQSIQSLLDRFSQTVQASIAGGGTISNDVVMDMARSMARLANDAAGRKELKRIQMIRRAQGRQVPLDMVTDMPAPGSAKNMPPVPIGMNIPRNTSAPDRPINLNVTPEEDQYLQQYNRSMGG